MLSWQRVAPGVVSIVTARAAGGMSGAERHRVPIGPFLAQTFPRRDPRRGPGMLLTILGICGFASALAARSIDPLVTPIAAQFAAPVAQVALLASAFTLPYSLGQPFLGPLGDFLGKAPVLKACLWLLTACLLGAALAPSLALLFASRIGAGAAAGGI